jgi:hypothetical protein
MAWESRQLLNRRFQSNMNQQDAFITGYWLLWWEIPERIYQVYTNLFGSDTYNAVSSVDDMIKALAALATGVPSIPDTTINQTSLNGLGGTKWGVTTNIDTPSTFSVKFRELAGMPILKTICSWFTLIRDPHTGASLLQGSDYTKRNFYGTAYLAYLKPDCKTVERGTVFEGICPTKYPSDLLNSDNGTVEALEPEIEFHVDSVWSDNSALEVVQDKVTMFDQFQPFNTGQGITDPTILQ